MVLLPDAEPRALERAMWLSTLCGLDWCNDRRTGLVQLARASRRTQLAAALRQHELNRVFQGLVKRRRVVFVALATSEYSNCRYATKQNWECVITHP